MWHTGVSQQGFGEHTAEAAWVRAPNFLCHGLHHLPCVDVIPRVPLADVELRNRARAVVFEPDNRGDPFHDN